MTDFAVRQAIAVVGAKAVQSLDLRQSVRMIECRTANHLRSIMASERIDAVVCAFGADGAVDAGELAKIVTDHGCHIPVLVRLRLARPDISEVVMLSGRGVDVRTSLFGLDDITVDILRLLRTCTTRSATADLLCTVLPSVPARCEQFGAAALLLGAKRRTADDLRRALDVNERLFRLRFAEIGMGASRMLGSCLVCHALRLQEAGQWNVNQIGSLLGFDCGSAFSDRVKLLTGFRPTAIRGSVTSLGFIEHFRDALRAAQDDIGVE